MRVSTDKWMVLVFLAGLAVTLAVWYFTGHFIFVLLLFPPLIFSSRRRPRKELSEDDKSEARR